MQKETESPIERSHIENPCMESLLLGVAVGDALGVPVEFKSRHTLCASPVKDMIGYGTHHQPPGTWSDDSSLTFCLAENLCAKQDIHDLARRFILWYDDAYWTAHGEVFDVGNATAKAIQRLKQGVEPTQAGGREEWSNGNGSLMRILPLAYFLLDVAPHLHFNRVRDISSVTHAHPRAVLSCYIYVIIAMQLLKGEGPVDAFAKMQETVNRFLSTNNVLSESDKSLFQRLLELDASIWLQFSIDDIKSSGYVIDTLEASLWCLMTTNNFEDAVLKAVNLGEDTDTTGAVTGGLAGILYGKDQIPDDWLNKLARKDDISTLASKCFAGWSL